MSFHTYHEYVKLIPRDRSPVDRSPNEYQPKSRAPILLTHEPFLRVRVVIGERVDHVLVIKHVSVLHDGQRILIGEVDLPFVPRLRSRAVDPPVRSILRPAVVEILRDAEGCGPVAGDVRLSVVLVVVALPDELLEVQGLAVRLAIVAQGSPVAVEYPDDHPARRGAASLIETGPVGVSGQRGDAALAVVVSADRIATVSGQRAEISFAVGQRGIPSQRGDVPLTGLRQHGVSRQRSNVPLAAQRQHALPSQGPDVPLTAR